MNPRRLHLQLRVNKHKEQELVLKEQKKRRFRLPKFIVSFFQYVFITFIAVGAAYTVEVGQWFILAFALYTLFIARDSKLTFGVAVFLIVTIPFFQLTKQVGIAENAAVYVFELLVIGTLQAALELRSQD
jgi:hypothetical protein